MSPPLSEAYWPSKSLMPLAVRPDAVSISSLEILSDIRPCSRSFLMESHGTVW